MPIFKVNNLQILPPNFFKISIYFHTIFHLIILSKAFVSIYVIWHDKQSYENYKVILIPPPLIFFH